MNKYSKYIGVNCGLPGLRLIRGNAAPRSCFSCGQFPCAKEMNHLINYPFRILEIDDKGKAIIAIDHETIFKISFKRLLISKQDLQD